MRTLAYSSINYWVGFSLSSHAITRSNLEDLGSESICRPASTQVLVALFFALSCYIGTDESYHQN